MANKKFEEWNVKPLYEKAELAEISKNGRKLIGFEKVGTEPIRTLTIQEHHLSQFNDQSENTLVRLYPVSA